MADIQVAILIPSMNRPEFIERTIRYYRDINSIHPVYIGDASAKSIQADVEKIISENPLTVRYFHWPKLNDRKTIAALAKLAFDDGVSYVAFHGDDDFFVPESLTVCAKFLAENDEYATAQGKAAVVTLDQPGPYGMIQSVGTYWEHNELISSKPIERLKEILKNYWVPQFSVHRTSDFLRTCDVYSQITNRNWGEIYHCTSFAVQGKSKHLDLLYLVRHIHPAIEHENFVEWLCMDTWFPSYELICKDLFRQLDDSQYTLERIQILMQSYLAKTIRDKNKIASTDFLKLLKIKLKKIIPGLVLLKHHFELHLKSSDDVALINDPKSKYYNQFAPIRQAFENTVNKID